jgi:ABC-type dipeptide/oligopeptide/nickel transport system permease component
MFRYIAGRIFQGLLILLLLTFVVFFAVRLMPGGRVTFTGENNTLVQYGRFMGGMLRGDLGYSARSHRLVSDEIGLRFLHTVVLTLGGALLAAGVGTALGILAAVRRDSIWDSVIMVFSLATVSIPMFFSALVLIIVFCLSLGWLPVIGADSPRGYILPMITLALPAIGFFTRTARTAMVDVLSRDYIRTSRARGLPEGLIIGGHALRNAVMPILTAIGVRFGELLAGTVLVENAFAIPGLGRLMVDAVSSRDYVMIQGSVLVFAAAFLGMNILVDVLYALADPKIAYR